MQPDSQAVNKQMQAIAEWKKRYIEAIVDELKPFGDVLLVGFGSGDAATYR